MKKKLIDLQDFSNELVKRLSQETNLVSIPRRKKVFRGRLMESAVLLLSDIHAGQVNKFPNPKTGAMEITYDTEAMVREADRLLDGIYTINQLLAASYKIDKLYIFGLGDLVENDLIFKGQRFFIDKGIVNQLISLTSLLANLFREFLKIYQEIEFVCVTGNHGRMAMGKEAAPTSNNFDYLAGKMLQLIFKDEPRVKVVLPDAWFHFTSIYGWRYFLHHGDTVYSWMSLPYYGLKRQGVSRRVEIPFDIECIGHFHQSMEIPIGGHSKTLVNGSWISKSDFGWRKFGTLSKAEQYYFGVSPKRPRTWGWTLDLLHSKDEWKQLPRERRTK